jgi:site-specific DNA recombinase
MSAHSARHPRSPAGHGHARRERSNTGMRVNGEPERWLLAARLSRLSRKDRERGDELINGIQTQDLRSAEWAQYEGHVIVHVTKDRNVSGAIAPWERPELGPWLTEPAKMVQYDGIVAYDVSRLSREYFDLAWLRKWAEENHKKLYVIKERLHWPDNRDGTLWGVAAERAYEERQEIIERVTRELDALRNAGKLASRYPFGYTSAGDKWDRYLTPTDEGRTYIPLIYRHCTDGCSRCAECCRHHAEGCQDCAGGWSLNKIARWLDDEGVKPAMGGKWWGKTVSDLIKNPTYMGHQCQRDIVPPDEVEESEGKAVRYRYGSTWTEAPRYQYGKTIHRCEPLVDAAVWKHANEALASRPRRGHIDPLNRAMLAEALFCPFCEDSPMYRLKGGGGRSRALYYYRCSGRGAHRKGCGNMVRLELVDAAVSKIMAESFDEPVMREEIAYGNEAELEAETQRIKFELRQLPARDLDWEEEDRERARLRAEQTRVASTTVIEDTVELVETDDTYLELWDRLSTEARGPWLAENGFRITASKDRVVVYQGTTKVEAEELGEPERMPAQPRKRVHMGTCGCGCGTDLYGVENPQHRIRYVNHTHAERARRQRLAAAKAQGADQPGLQEPVYLGKCGCGCGTDLYGTENNRKRYVDKTHKHRAEHQRTPAGETQATEPTEP